MEYIETKIERIQYPVGSNIQENIPIINQMAKVINELFVDEYINLLCMGSSGAIIASIVALSNPKMTIIHVKKDGEDSHSTSLTSKYDNAKNVIIDDFIATGDTLNKIYRKFKSRMEWLNSNVVIDAVCVTGSSRGLEFEPTYFICSER